MTSGPPGAAVGDVLALDVGGTKPPAALVSPDGRVRRAATRRTPGGGAEVIWDALADTVAEVLGGGRAAVAAIGSAGPLGAARRDYAGLAFVRRTELVPSELGGTAALLGVAALARNPELV